MAKKHRSPIPEESAGDRVDYLVSMQESRKMKGVYYPFQMALKTVAPAILLFLVKTQVWAKT